MAGFWGLVSAHSLGAFNDNAVRWFLIALTMKEVAEEGRAPIVALASVLFLAPYVVFSVHAGLLADRYPKRNVLLASKAAEGAIMVLATIALFVWPHFDRQLYVLLGALLLLGIQAAYYSPAKYGTIPEMLPERYMSWGNGIFEMTGVCAIILGSACGSGFLLFVDREREAAERLLEASWGLGLLGAGLGSDGAAAVSTLTSSLGMASFEIAGNRRFLAPALLTAASVLGLAGTILVPRHAAALGAVDRRRALPVFVDRCRKFFGHRVILVTIVAIIAMWSFGLLLQLNLALYAKEALGLKEHQLGLVMGVVAVGVASGNVLAGYISGRTIELGLVPLGGFGAALFLASLRFTEGSLALSCAVIWLVGLFAGMFIVPLHANLQEETEDEDKGGVWGATNCLQTIGMLLAAGSFLLLEQAFGLSAPQIFLVSGFAIFALTALVVAGLPECVGRLAVWLLVRPSIRLSIEGQRHVPPRGPILFLAAVESPEDSQTILFATRRFVRFVLPRPERRTLFARLIERTLRPIYVPSPGDPQAPGEDAARSILDALARGEAACVPVSSRADGPGLSREALVRVLEAAPAPAMLARIEREPGSRRVRLAFEPPCPRPATALLASPDRSLPEAERVSS